MQNLFDDDAQECVLIRREEVLLPDYLPDELLHRSDELQAIADAVKPLLRKRDSDNLFIRGKSGTGKTSCAKFVMKQLSEHSPNVLPVYVNCWENPTKSSVFNRIIEAMELPLPRRGLGPDELFDRMLQFIRNYSKPVLLVLDELDGLQHEDLLYLVARANEKPGILFGIIGISNNPGFLSKLDPRVRSSLRFSEMEFREYSEEQLFSILKERATLGLAEGSYDEKLLRKIARSVDDGSARIALERLWKAAKHAEGRGSRNIMLQDLADSEDGIRPGAVPSEIEEMVVKKLKEGQSTSSKLYESLGIDRSKRQFMNYLYLLEKKGVIIMDEQPQAGGNEKFRPRVCRLK